MRKLNDNEWLLLNEIIYMINTTNPIENAQGTFLSLMKHLIYYDSALFYRKNPANKYKDKVFLTPICVNYDIDTAERYISIGQEKDYTLGIMQCSKSMICRETDLLPDDEREHTEYYRLFLKPQDLHYGIQLTCVHEGILTGIVSFLRKRESGNFNEKDIFVLEIIKDHLSHRLYSIGSNDAAAGNFKDLKSMEEKYSLTKREFEVLELLIRNYSNDDISKTLIISGNTVKKHILNIYKKLDVNSRLQLFQLVSD